jgi:hypothetical protein
MTPARRQAAESSWLYALAGALLLGGPVWHYLFVNRYPFSRPEALVLPLLAALLGAAIAVGGHRAGDLVGGLVFGVLLYLFVDWQLDLEKSMPTVVVVAGCLALPQLLRAHRAVLACIVLGTFDLASLPRAQAGLAPSRGESSSRPPAGPPLLLHLVLDEQWGIGGLRAAGDSATAAFLAGFYRQRGFEVYQGAYSRWNTTARSIPEALSLGRPVDLRTPPEAARPRVRFRLTANPYFARLRELGYAIHVYQTTDLDYCHPADVAVASCATWSANSIANVGYLPGAWTGRAMLAGRYFLNAASYAYRRLKRPPDDPVWGQAVVGGGLAALGTVRDAITAGEPRATAIFVHVLLPHRPLEVDAGCRAYSNPARRVGNSLPAQLGDSSWRALVTLYGAQDRCIHRAVGEVLVALDRAVGRDGAIVIVHGDHGARLTQSDPADAPASQLNIQQLNATYSTLLAVRRPEVPGDVHTESVPLQDFLWDLVGKDFRGEATGAWVHYVHHVANGLAIQVDAPRALSGAEMPWAHPIH